MRALHIIGTIQTEQSVRDVAQRGRTRTRRLVRRSDASGSYSPSRFRYGHANDGIQRHRVYGRFLAAASNQLSGNGSPLALQPAWAPRIEGFGIRVSAHSVRLCEADEGAWS